MAKAKVPHLRSDFPVYAEKCALCTHAQAMHMQAAAGSLTGRWNPDGCREVTSGKGEEIQRCGCDTWSPSWKEA